MIGRGCEPGITRRWNSRWSQYARLTGVRAGGSGPARCPDGLVEPARGSGSGAAPESVRSRRRAAGASPARLGGLIGRIHRQSARIASPVTRETFATLHADDLWRILARAREEPASDEPRRGLRAFLDEQEPAIREGWEDFEAIARACHEASFELVLTHGDWPFNLLQGADDTLYLIDWDELLLAPAERDTWYAGDESAFWQGYRAQRPGHAASELATAYYVHHRYFEELISFAQTILGDDPLERRAWSIDLLGGDWMAGLRAQMRITPPP